MTTSVNTAQIIRKLEVKLYRQKAAVAETEQHIEAMRNIEKQQDIENAKTKTK